jgi:hypothetical protein
VSASPANPASPLPFGVLAKPWTATNLARALRVPAAA